MTSKLTLWKILFHILMFQQNLIKTRQNLHMNVVVAYRENGVPSNIQSWPGHLKRRKSKIIIYVENDNVATLALGSRPRQKGCKVTGQEEARELRQEEVWESHHKLPRVLESVKEWTLTLPRQLPLGRWSPGGFPKLQRVIVGVKTQWFMAFFISLESSWSVNV